MKIRFLISTTVFLCILCAKQVKKSAYPKRFDELSQLVLATDTRNIAFPDASIRKVIGEKFDNGTISAIANVTFELYLDFQQDGYTVQFSEPGDTLYFNAPAIRVKKPVINSSQFTYYSGSLLPNEENEAAAKLEEMKGDFIAEGNSLLKDERTVSSCTETLRKYLFDLCREKNVPTKTILITYIKPAAQQSLKR